MPLVKFCHSRDIDKILGGSIRISSLAWFRYLEDESANAFIGDRLEGQAITRLDLFECDGVVSDKDREIVRRTGIVVEEGVSNLTVRGAMTVADCGHWLIFSTARQETPSIEAWNAVATTDSQYDACVEIRDVELLEQRIWDTGTIDGVPVSQLFERPGAADVTYARREADATMLEAPLEASPFVKRPAYEAQKEFRIAWRPLDRVFRDIAHVKFDATDLFVEIARDRSAPASAPSLQRPPEDVARDLVSLLHEIRLHAASSREADLGSDDDACGTDEQWRAYAARVSDQIEARNEQFYSAHSLQSIKSLFWEARLLGYRPTHPIGYVFEPGPRPAPEWLGREVLSLVCQFPNAKEMWLQQQPRESADNNGE